MKIWLKFQSVNNKFKFQSITNPMTENMFPSTGQSIISPASMEASCFLYTTLNQQAHQTHLSYSSFCSHVLYFIHRVILNCHKLSTEKNFNYYSTRCAQKVPCYHCLGSLTNMAWITNTSIVLCRITRQIEKVGNMLAFFLNRKIAASWW